MGRVFLFLLLLFSSLTLNKNLVHGQTWSKTSLNNYFISDIETSVWGVLAGEHDQRIWNDPYNGIYISKDFGGSWDEVGLEGRGVNDIEYSNNKIFASTYYFLNNKAGLFVSNDSGKSWNHLCNDFSTSSVSVSANNILLGTFSHGLWLSKDGGETWQQKIGGGYFGPEVLETEFNNETAITTTKDAIFLSYNSGETWQENSSLKNINRVLLKDNLILLGGPEGLYKSTDNGWSWSHITNWGERLVGGITIYKDRVFAGCLNKTTNRYDIYESKDLGETWLPTNLPQIYNYNLPTSANWVFSDPSYIFVSVPREGIYKYSIPKNSESGEPFLEIPWQTSNKGELIERIYSFFDHEYPLLGYEHFVEPPGTSSTTLNYLGYKENEPTFYYSSHDGYDFTLSYGTPILAGYSGYASYGYDQGGLGHYITINHQNGYETTYAHLQNENLVTKNVGVWVETGQQIGLIGMSGNTTGPHLHFSIRKLSQPSPDGITDPFGWQTDLINDPWKTFSWTDLLGTHNGTSSNYLWTFNPKTYALSNKQVIIDANSTEENFTVFIEPYAYPKVPITQNKLTYITGTSMLINIYNILGQEIPELLEPAIIEVDISNANTEDLLENTINIYTWNEETSLWEPIPSFYNYLTGKVTGETKHFSKFAVFGIDKSTWLDKVRVLDTNLTVK